MKINSFGGNEKDLHFSNTTPLPFLFDPHLLSSSTARLCFLSSLPIKPRAKRVAISLIPLLKPILCLHQNLMDSIRTTKMKICHAKTGLQCIWGEVMPVMPPSSSSSSFLSASFSKARLAFRCCRTISWRAASAASASCQIRTPNSLTRSQPFFLIQRVEIQG